jgi:tryptophan-rich sensory protein
MRTIFPIPIYSWVLTALVLTAMLVGNLFTAPNLEWYDTIIKPAVNPPDWVFGPIWTLLYLLLIYASWRLGRLVGERDIRFWFVVYLFGLNLILNGMWSYLFFAEHLLGAALIDAVVLAVTAMAIAFLSWPINRHVTLVFSLYSVWLAFASYLSYQIWLLN